MRVCVLVCSLFWEVYAEKLSTSTQDRSCLGYWRKDQQVTAGLLLFVAGMTLLTKVRA